MMLSRQMAPHGGHIVEGRIGFNTTPRAAVILIDT